LICFRSIKLCFLQIFKLGFDFSYFKFCREFDILNSLFVNIFFNGIESFYFLNFVYLRSFKIIYLMF